MLTVYEITPDYAWTDITPSVIRFLWQTGLRLAEEQDQTQQIFGFWLGESHPAYEVTATQLPRERKPYSYFVRVADLPAFLEHIKPALEQRLVHSAFVNYSGEIKLNFYRDGISLNFTKGRLEEIKALTASELSGCDASFPPLVFLHLAFGHRAMGELRYAFTDCSAKDDETMHLLDALFPKKPSKVWDIS